VNLKAPYWLKDLNGAWIFYTLLPSVPKIEPGFNRIARFGPVIGIVIGGIQSIVWLLLNYLGWGEESLAFVCISIGFLITGGIHIDGLMDTADGIGAGKEKRLKAMKDSRVGAIGVMSLMILILIQSAALIELNSFAPLIMPLVCFWGRFSSLWAIWNFPYIQKEGKAGFHRKYWQGWNELKPTFIILMILLLFIQVLKIESIIKFNIILCIAIGLGPSIIIPQIIGRKMKGHSGDTYGASLVIVETLLLTLYAIVLPVI
tara:strand:+ start:378 stop:1157 length:780 start_codon:yes stop_codon:yes gene_type:complete